MQINVLLDPAPARPYRAANTAKCWQNCRLNHIEVFDLKHARWSIKASPEAMWIIPWTASGCLSGQGGHMWWVVCIAMWHVVVPAQITNALGTRHFGSNMRT